MASGDAPAEILPTSGFVFNEVEELREILCPPKLLPIKSFSLERLETLEKRVADEANAKRSLRRQQQSAPMWNTNTAPATDMTNIIADPKVRSLLSEAQTLQRQRENTLEALRSVFQAKCSCLSENAPTVDFLMDISSAIDSLMQRKEELIVELDGLKSQQSEISKLREELRAMGIEMNAYNAAAREAELRLQRETEKLQSLREENESRVSRMRFPTVEQAEKELHRLERELAKCSHNDNSNSSSTAVMLISKRTQAERAKEELNELNALNSRFSAQSVCVEKCRTYFTAKTAGRSEKEEAQKELKKRLKEWDDNSAERNAKFNALRSEISEIQQEIAEERSRRKEKRPVSTEINALRQEHNSLLSTVRATEKRLTAIQKELPCCFFTCPPEVKKVLLAKGGATLEQLQVDFGVAMCIEGMGVRKGFVVGGKEDIDAAVAAIGEIAAAEAAYSHKIVLPYDSAMRTHLVGKNGANVRRIELESGARVDIARDLVTLRGTEADIAVAQKLVENFLSNHYRAELPILPEELPFIIGKNGGVIGRLEKETGVGALHVDRNVHKIIAIGPQDCVDEAMRRCKELLADIRQTH